MIYNYKSKAGRIFWYKRDQCAKSNTPFDLDKEWIFENLILGCALTKLEFSLNEEKISPMSPSIDRIDPKGGYIKTNCRIILNGLNMMKSAESSDDMLYTIARALLNPQEAQTHIFTDAELRYKLEEFLTPKQSDIVISKKHGLLLSKSEQEYFSRAIKKKLKYLSSLLPWVKELQKELK
jgi:hypothetical protein